MIKEILKGIWAFCSYLFVPQKRNHEDYSSDVKNSDTDGSQRMLNAIEPGSILPIHRHQKTSETMVCLRGRLQVEFYDELERICTDSFVIEPNGINVAVSIPIGVWHTVHALESGTCVLEMKDGKYEPLSDVDILK